MGNLITLPLFTFAINLTMLLASACGRHLPVSTRPEIADTTQLQSAGLAGILQLTASETELNLADLPSPMRPTILMFAADTCSTCREEAQALVTLFGQHQALPSNINLYTVMLGGFREDALDWAQDLEVSWPVAIDLHQDQVFKRYCPEQQTPCIIIYHPGKKQVNKFIGHSSILDWQKETGTWIY